MRVADLQRNGTEHRAPGETASRNGIAGRLVSHAAKHSGKPDACRKPGV